MAGNDQFVSSAVSGVTSTHATNNGTFEYDDAMDNCTDNGMAIDDSDSSTEQECSWSRSVSSSAPTMYVCSNGRGPHVDSSQRTSSEGDAPQTNTTERRPRTKCHNRSARRRETNKKAARKSRTKEKEKEASLIRESLDEESRRTCLRHEIRQLTNQVEQWSKVLNDHAKTNRCVLSPIINSHTVLCGTTGVYSCSNGSGTRDSSQRTSCDAQHLPASVQDSIISGSTLSTGQSLRDASPMSTPSPYPTSSMIPFVSYNTSSTSSMVANCTQVAPSNTNCILGTPSNTNCTLGAPSNTNYTLAAPSNTTCTPGAPSNTNENCNNVDGSQVRVTNNIFVPPVTQQPATVVAVDSSISALVAGCDTQHTYIPMEAFRELAVNTVRSWQGPNVPPACATVAPNIITTTEFATNPTPVDPITSDDYTSFLADNPTSQNPETSLRNNGDALITQPDSSIAFIDQSSADTNNYVIVATEMTNSDILNADFPVYFVDTVNAANVEVTTEAVTEGVSNEVRQLVEYIETENNNKGSIVENTNNHSIVENTSNHLIVENTSNYLIVENTNNHLIAVSALLELNRGIVDDSNTQYISQ